VQRPAPSRFFPGDTVNDFLGETEPFTAAKHPLATVRHKADAAAEPTEHAAAITPGADFKVLGGPSVAEHAGDLKQVFRAIDKRPLHPVQ
jgi:hypothetical protein